MTVVRVLPDVPAVDRHFDYAFDGHLDAGTLVRVPFSGRQVRGWVLESDVEPPPGIEVRAVSKVLGVGPDAETIELCRWAAWRWGGRFVTMLRVATHDRLVRVVPKVRVRPVGPPRGADGVSQLEEISASLLLLGAGAKVLQVSPVSDPLDIAAAAASTGQALVVTPSPAVADRIARGLRARGGAVARWPNDWAAAAGGATVVGGRTSVFAPLPELSAVVVLDEHDELLQNESSPTWNARDVAVERARRAGVPCILVSPCPSLEALAAQSPIPAESGPADAEFVRPVGVLPRSVVRRGWAPLVVVDRRGEDTGRSGLFSDHLVKLMREAVGEKRTVTCVLNRTGRARLLACRSCSTVASCEVCGAAVYQDDDSSLVCLSCGSSRPGICAECGSTALALLRLGVSRAREELEALLRVRVGMVTARSSGDDESGRQVVIGTRAVLNRRHRSGLVAFLDFDQELLAPRYRAAEDALSLLATASRQVGGRNDGGAVVVQTHFPEHVVVQSALRADPALHSVEELGRRRLLGFPPAASVAVVGREGAPEFIHRLGSPDGVNIGGSGDGEWLIRSKVPGLLQDAIAAVERPPGRLRLWVDPMRLT